MSVSLLTLQLGATSSAPPSELIRSAVLGVVQGLTEFLPISSSAHLILFSKFAGWPDQGLAFDIAANTGTLAALLLYFWRDLIAIARRAVATRHAQSAHGDPSRRQWPMWWWLVVATVPVALFGLFGATWIAGEGRNATLIATTSIGFGILLWIADRRAMRHAERAPGEEPRTLDPKSAVPLRGPRLGMRDALALGVAQAIALIPGTSRSGAVMTAGLFRDFDRTSAARLAFLMAIPVGLLVATKNAFDLLTTAEVVSWTPMIVGFLGAAISGYVVIALLLEWLKHRGLLPFVIYRIALGIALLLLSFN